MGRDPGDDAEPLAARVRHALPVAALVGLSALAWLALGASPDHGMRTGVLTGGGSMTPGSGAARSPAMPALLPALFLSTWLVMMVAMMFPSIAPVVVTIDRWVRKTGRSRWTIAWFVGGYLLVWGGSGLLAYAAIVHLPSLLPSGEAAVRLGAGSLVLAGAYQLTPLKRVCLRHCRSPLAFVAHHASALRRSGLDGMRTGAVHGMFCLGCCWALMMVLVLLGMMSLTWMAAVAGVILLEKVLPRSWPVGGVVGLVLVIAGLALVAAPRTLPALP